MSGSGQLCFSAMFLAIAASLVFTNCCFGTANASRFTPKLFPSFVETRSNPEVTASSANKVQKSTAESSYSTQPTDSSSGVSLLPKNKGDPSSSLGLSLSQPDASLFHFKYRLMRVPFGSAEYLETKKQLDDIVAKMKYEDDRFHQIGKLLFRYENGLKVLNNVQPAGEHCPRILMEIYAKHCGRLSVYGLKHMGDIHDMCHAGVTAQEMAAASIKVCSN